MLDDSTQTWQPPNNHPSHGAAERFKGAARLSVPSASKRFLREPAGKHSQSDGTRARAPPAIPPAPTLLASTPSVLPRSQEGAIPNTVDSRVRHA